MFDIRLMDYTTLTPFIGMIPSEFSFAHAIILVLIFLRFDYHSINKFTCFPFGKDLMRQSISNKRYKIIQRMNCELTIKINGIVNSSIFSLIFQFSPLVLVF